MSEKMYIQFIIKIMFIKIYSLDFQKNTHTQYIINIMFIKIYTKDVQKNVHT